MWEGEYRRDEHTGVGGTYSCGNSLKAISIGAMEELTVVVIGYKIWAHGR